MSLPLDDGRMSMLEGGGDADGQKLTLLRKAGLRHDRRGRSGFGIAGHTGPILAELVGDRGEVEKRLMDLGRAQAAGARPPERLDGVVSQGVHRVRGSLRGQRRPLGHRRGERWRALDRYERTGCLLGRAGRLPGLEDAE